jgi:hypothetical protein
LLKRLNMLLTETVLKDIPWLHLAQCGEEWGFKFKKNSKFLRQLIDF